MDFVSPILIIVALLLVVLIILGLAVKRFRKQAIIVSVALVLLVTGIFIIPYNMAVSSKNIRTEAICNLESDMKDEFGINSLKISIGRGDSATIVISVDDDFDVEKYEAVQNAITEDTIDYIINYCANNFKDAFVPARNNFALLIQNGDNILYRSDI